MDYWQKQISDRLEAFQRDNHRHGFAVSIKLRVPRCFCREHHAAMAHRLIDDYRNRHPLDRSRCEYVEHESGPELLLYLGLGVAALGIARESVSVVKSAIELVAAIVKARSEGRKKGDDQHGPLVIVVRGFDADGAFYEKQVLKARVESPPNQKAIEESLMGVIQLIAEERARQKQ